MERMKEKMDNTPEEQQDYYKKVQTLLSHYVDGWDIFINAHKAKDFDYPLIRKPEFKDDPYLPQTWLELVAEVQGIIAKDKFGLEVYAPHIEVIRSDQMLDLYTTIGLPNSYKHWSFGKARMQEERKYDATKSLAYEIVINSLPCIAFCMDTNTPVMQMLVIAHACYGHNAVFKNNHLFTSAETILTDMKHMRDFVFECEGRYGWREVSDLLDFCHAMRFMNTPDTTLQKKLTEREMKERAEQRKIARFEETPRTSVFNLESEAEAEDKIKGKESFPYRNEKNILRFMADHDERFPQWKRTIMKMSSDLAQYFKPQTMTQTLNEGFATYTHMKILKTMVDMGLMDYSMNMEFNSSNDGVTYQPSAIKKVRDPDSGEIYEQFVGARMNPYALGYAMYNDIERICTNPTDEDKQWFKHFAGKGNAQEMVIHAMENSSDETFVEQYLSPAVMRKFAFFEIEDQEVNDYLEVTAIHDADGFRKIRAQLAKDYRTSDHIPNISIYNYQDTDRCLILRHQIKDGKPLESKSLEHILQLIHNQRGFPVVVESVDESGEVKETFSSPPKYDYKKFRRVEQKNIFVP